MADNKLVIKINGDSKGYSDALKKAAGDTKELQEKLNNVAKTSAIAFAGLTASIGASVAAYRVQEQAEIRTAATIKATGQAAGLTAQEIFKMASSLQEITTYGDESIIAGQNLLLTFRNIGKDVFPRATATMLDMSTAMGTDLKSSAIQLGKALNDPITGLSALSRVGITFSEDQKEMIKTMQESGNIAGAQAVILAELENQFGGVSEAAAKGTGIFLQLNNEFGDVVEMLGKEMMPALTPVAELFKSFFLFLKENPILAKIASRVLLVGAALTGITAVLALTGTLFLKLKASMLVAALGAKGLTFAIKGLIGSTGIGLLLVFLPEILSLFKSVFSGIVNVVKNAGGAIASAVGAIGKIMLGLFTFNLTMIKKGLSDFGNAFSMVATATAEEWNRKNEVVKDSTKKTTKVIAEESQKVVDTEQEAADKSKNIQDEKGRSDTQALSDRKAKLEEEQEILRAANEGMAQEEIGFIKRRQELARERSAMMSIIDDEERKLALQNSELKHKQLETDIQTYINKKRELAAQEVKIAEEKEASELEKLNIRKQKLQEEQEALIAQKEGLTKTEIEFQERRKKIIEDYEEIAKIKNEEEKTLALENNSLKNRALIEDERIYFEERDALRAEQQEKEAMLQEELQEISKEQREALQKEELESLKKSLVTQEKARSKAVADEIIATRKENEQFKKDEIAHGTAIAQFKALMRNEDVKGYRDTAGQLAQLQNSENSKMAAVGKAAALVQIGISTAEGAIKAYTSLAGIPIVGPALGITAAGLLVAYGAERANEVRGAQMGGVVGGFGSGDIMPFMLEPGELIAPKQNFDEVVNAVADARNSSAGVSSGGDGEQSGRTEVLIGFDGEEAADVLTLRQNEANVLGYSEQF